VLGELIDLFARREPITAESEFPSVGPTLDSYGFPHEVLSEERLRGSLDPAQLEVVRALVADGATGSADGLTIRYEPAWTDPFVAAEGSVQMVCSQAVLEHVDDLETAYRALRRWLVPGGLMSHHIDFTSHGTARVGNGHWTFSDLEWRLIRGRRRSWFINRPPIATHLHLLRANGFRMTEIQRGTAAPEFGPERLARRFRAPRRQGPGDHVGVRPGGRAIARAGSGALALTRATTVRLAARRPARAVSDGADGSLGIRGLGRGGGSGRSYCVVARPKPAPQRVDLLRADPGPPGRQASETWPRPPGRTRSRRPPRRAAGRGPRCRRPPPVQAAAGDGLGRQRIGTRQQGDVADELGPRGRQRSGHHPAVRETDGRQRYLEAVLRTAASTQAPTISRHSSRLASSGTPIAWWRNQA
jgi:hypothetical protein